MMAVPALRPVTLPSPSTVATLELLLIQTMKYNRSGRWCTGSPWGGGHHR